MAAKNTTAAGGSGGILAIIFPGVILAATLYVTPKKKNGKMFESPIRISYFIKNAQSRFFAIRLPEKSKVTIIVI